MSNLSEEQRTALKEIQFMWDGGETRRFHCYRPLMEDTVGHHSYNVACIIMFLWEDASARLLRAALKHDMAEHIVGDMPAPAKRSLPDYPDSTFREEFGFMEDRMMARAGIIVEHLSPEEQWCLKLADSMDGLRFCMHERALGNNTPRMVDMAKTFTSYIDTLMVDKRAGGCLNWRCHTLFTYLMSYGNVDLDAEYAESNWMDKV